MEKSPKRRHHSDEFKREAVELANRVGITKAAVELGVHETSIRAWKKQFEDPQKSLDGYETSTAQKSYSDLEKENKRLLKENGYLKEINNVLKKSTAIFSADHMGSSR